MKRPDAGRSGSGVTILDPFVIPFHDLNIVRRINERSLLAAIRKRMATLNFHNPIVLSSSPIIAPLVGKLGETSSHYFCLDEYSKFNGTFLSIKEFEASMIEKSDSSYFVSDVLLEKKRLAHRPAYYLPQGLELEHFRPVSRVEPISLKLPGRPIVGYHGVVGHWVDVELINMCAERYPDLNFVIVGKTTLETDLSFKETNVTHLGAVPYQDLPKYISLFDIGLIPFQVNELTIASNPLKLLEYLAFGLPVVSTDLPEVRKLQEVVYIAKGREDFINLIQEAIREDNSSKMQKRREIASKYSWKSIVEDISNNIINLEKEKGASSVKHYQNIHRRDNNWGEK
jgi:hypothetical protein